MTQPGDFDLLVAGGGLVGTSLARALAGSPLRIALVEAIPPGDAGQPSFDDRSTALAPSSRRLLRVLGCWAAIEAEATPIRTIHVSDQGHFGLTRLRAADEGLDALGHVVPNRALGQALADCIAGQENLRVFSPARVTSLEQGDDAVTACLEGAGVPERLRARLVVAADGSRSPIRRQLGLELSERDYGQSGVVANVAVERDHAGWAFERFTREGPLALLPLPERRCALVWTMGHERAQRILALDDAAFLAALQRAFGFRLGRLLRVGRRQSYPLHLLRVRERLRGRVVVLGNAARTLHPVAGQGFNLALRDVAELAECLDAGVREGADPGDPAALKAYDRARRADERRVVTFTDGLVRLFSNRDPLLTLGRNLGLVAMDLLPGLRRRLAQQAMGRHGRLPRLSRGLPLRHAPD